MQIIESVKKFCEDIKVRFTKDKPLFTVKPTSEIAEDGKPLFRASIHKKHYVRPTGLADYHQIIHKDEKLNYPRECFNYLIGVCETEDVLYELLERLESFGAVGLYVDEHKRQRTMSDFGINGKMVKINDDRKNSGIDFVDSEKGFQFWKDRLRLVL